MRGWAIILAFPFSVFIEVLFGAYPAKTAAGLPTIEALRQE